MKKTFSYLWVWKADWDPFLEHLITDVGVEGLRDICLHVHGDVDPLEHLNPVHLPDVSQELSTGHLHHAVVEVALLYGDLSQGALVGEEPGAKNP